MKQRLLCWLGFHWGAKADCGAFALCNRCGQMRVRACYCKDCTQGQRDAVYFAIISLSKIRLVRK